jgi:hypothetical protein
MRALLAGAALLALLASPPAGAETQSRTIEPGQFLEVNLDLTAGQRVPWTMSVEPATERAFYNIHTHAANGSVVNFDQGVLNRTVSGMFTVPYDGLFSWLVDNLVSHQALDATVTVEPPPPAKPLPGVPLAAFAAAALLVALLQRRPPPRPVRGPPRALV